MFVHADSTLQILQEIQSLLQDVRALQALHQHHYDEKLQAVSKEYEQEAHTLWQTLGNEPITTTELIEKTSSVAVNGKEVQ